MLAIRLQRTGRSGHAQFRVIVQDSRFSPKRGRIVEYLGNYDPHTKTATVDSQKAAKYLESGAQPSDRVAKLLQKEGIKLPGWVKLSQPQKRTVRHPEKRRSTRPAQPETPAAPEPGPAAEEAAAPANTEPAPAAEQDSEQTAEQTPEPAPEAPAPQEAPAEEPASQAPAAEQPTEPAAGETSKTEA
jgi:small subunit ribosomal protein S16